MIRIFGPIAVQKKGPYFMVYSTIDIDFQATSQQFVNLPLTISDQLSWAFYPNPKYSPDQLTMPITKQILKNRFSFSNKHRISIKSNDVLGYLCFFKPIMPEQLFPQQSTLVGIVVGNQQNKYLNRQIAGNQFQYGPFSFQTTIYFKKHNNFLNFYVGKQNYLSQNPMKGQFSQAGFNHIVGPVINFLISPISQNQVKLSFQGDSIQFRPNTLYISNTPTIFFLYQQPQIVYSSRFIASYFKYFAPIGIISSTYAYSSFSLTPLQISIDGNQITFLFRSLPVQLQIRNNRLYVTSQINNWFVQIVSQTVIHIKNQEGLYLAQTSNQNFTLQTTPFVFSPPHQRYGYLVHSQNENKFLTRFNSKNFRFRTWHRNNPIFDKELEQFIGVNFYIDQVGIIRDNDGISRPLSWKLIYQGNHRYSIQLLSNNKFLCVRKASGGVINFDYWPWFDISVSSKALLSFYDASRIPQPASLLNFSRILPINLAWKRKFSPQRIVLLGDLNSTNQQLLQFNYFNCIQDDFYQVHSKIPLIIDFAVVTLQNMYSNRVPNQSWGGSIRLFLKNIRQRDHNNYQSQFWVQYEYNKFPLTMTTFGELRPFTAQQSVMPFRLRFYLQNTIDNNQFGVWGDQQNSILKTNDKFFFDPSGYPLKMKNIGNYQYIFGQFATQTGDIYQNQPISLWQKKTNGDISQQRVYIIAFVGDPPSVSLYRRIDKHDGEKPPKMFAISSRPQLFVVSRKFNFFAECSPPILNNSPFTLKFLDSAFKDWQTMSFIDPTSDIF